MKKSDEEKQLYQETQDPRFTYPASSRVRILTNDSVHPPISLSDADTPPQPAFHISPRPVQADDPSPPTHWLPNYIDPIEKNGRNHPQACLFVCRSPLLSESVDRLERVGMACGVRLRLRSKMRTRVIRRFINN